MSRTVAAYLFSFLCMALACNGQVTSNGVANQSVVVTGSETYAAISAPSTPAAGFIKTYLDSTSKNFSAKNESGTVSVGVVPASSTSHQWINAISAAGVISKSQPAYSDISGTLDFSTLTVTEPATGGASQTVASAIFRPHYLQDFGAVCDGSTDDSSHMNAAWAAYGTIHIRSGKICAMKNIAIPTNGHLVCDGILAGVRLVAGSTTASIITSSFTNNISIENCLIDGNSVNTSAPLISINNSAIVLIKGNEFESSGDSSHNVEEIQVYNSDGVQIDHNTALWQSYGSFATIDFGNATNAVQVTNNIIYGQSDNAIFFEHSGGTGSSDFCNGQVAGNNIQNTTDYESGGSAGGNGNGILVYQCWGTTIADNYLNNQAWSGIRLGVNAAMNNAHDNTIINSGEQSMYCGEEGGFANHCHHNHIYGGDSGITSTNQGSRLVDLPDEVDNNFIYGTMYFGIHGEGTIIHDNYVLNSAVGYTLGAGSTTGGDRFFNNHCLANVTTFAGAGSTYGSGQPMSTCVIVDAGTSSIYQEQIYNNDLGLNYGTAAYQLPVAILGVNNSAGITSISKATSAHYVVSGSVPSQFIVGARICFWQVQGMTQINGQCPAITAVAGSTMTLNLNTTTYSTYTSGTGFTNALWNNNTSAPFAGLGAYDRVQDTDIPYSVVAASAFATGSHFFVPDGKCPGGTLAGSGTGVWLNQVNSSTLVCNQNTDGTIAATPAFISSGSATTIAAGTGAGTSPTVTTGGHANAGILNITTGTGSPATAATLATVTFVPALPQAPGACVIEPANSAASVLAVAAKPYVSATSTTTFTVTTATTALATSTAYKWWFNCF